MAFHFRCGTANGRDRGKIGAANPEDKNVNIL